MSCFLKVKGCLIPDNVKIIIWYELVAGGPYDKG